MADIDKKKVIKQIKTDSSNVFTIDAPLWCGKTFGEIESMIHGVVDTYVIPSTVSSTASGYDKVVATTSAQTSTTKAILNALTSTSATYKVGDIILMGATSDGTKHFDRWVSKVSGTGNSAIIYLDVLETQVATHHHTITTSSAKALTDVSETTPTTNKMATVGSATTVVIGKTATDLSSGYDFLTSINHVGGSYSITASTTGDSSDGHSHTVNSHAHSVTLGNGNLVSASVKAYTALSTSSYQQHTHTTASVAGVATASTTINYVNGGTQDKAIKTLKYTETDTSGATATTDGVSLNTGIQVSSSASSNILTAESGKHSHTLSSAQTANVITSATIAGNVITSVTAANNTTVATTVVTSVTKVSKNVLTSAKVTGTFVTNTALSVDASGVLVLSFSTGAPTLTTSSTIVSAIDSINTGSQSAAAPTLSVTSAIQSVSYGKVSVSGSTSASGSHSHGFTHTHTIDSHSHTVNSHTHKYSKAEENAVVSAYISLATDSHTTHTHDSVAVAGAHSNDTNITYVYGGTTTSVVRSLVSNKSFTTTAVSTETDTKYYNLDITYPGLSLIGRKFETTSITEASSTDETPIKAITFTSASFINSVGGKTSKNIGGE